MDRPTDPAVVAIIGDSVARVTREQERERVIGILQDLYRHANDETSWGKAQRAVLRDAITRIRDADDSPT